MNSKVTSLNLRTTCVIAALSLNLTASASLAQSSASGQAASQASNQAATQSSGQAATQSSGQASTQASNQSANKTKTVNWNNSVPVSTAAGTTNKTAPAAAPAPTTAATKTSDLVALQGPTVVTQKGSGWKTTSTFVELKDGQQALPLTFTVTNGVNGAAKMQGISVKLNGREILAPKNFQGKDTVAINLSDLVSSGQSQLIFQTYGPTNAACSWVITTVKIKVTDIKPVNCAIGDVVKISGKNFPLDKSAYKITVDQKPAVIKAASATSLDFIVPQGLTGGKKTVTLFIAGVKCEPLYLKIAAAPEVTGCNMLASAPGSDITISGTGFSTTASDNQVIFKNPDGSIMSTVTAKSASETSLTVTVPMDLSCPSDCLVTVKTKGQESSKGVNFSCSTRVIDKGVLQ